MDAEQRLELKNAENDSQRLDIMELKELCALLASSRVKWWSASSRVNQTVTINLSDEKKIKKLWDKHMSKFGEISSFTTRPPPRKKSASLIATNMTR